jgi:beta-mannosidase
MRQTYLHSNWVFKNASAAPPFKQDYVQPQPWLPASVPGHVHLDLVDAGIIVHPFEGLAELGCRWVDEADWAYKTTFEWHPDSLFPTRVLKFEGLDTVCEVLLNGVPIGAFDNMFVPVEIDVTAELKDGENEIEVRFESPIRVGRSRRDAYFAAEGLPVDCRQFEERAFVRKAQYMSSWDWGPRLASCGIWQPVSLIEFASRIKEFTVLQSFQEDGSVRVWTETVAEGSGMVTLTFGEIAVTSDASAIEEIDIVVPDPQLWWPNGMGEQNLYQATASLGGDVVTRQVGLRSVLLERAQDEVGESFTFYVNGQPVWARGANWIPNDSFPSVVSGEDYRNQIAACQALGMNMLRVWGGGLYELEEFYDACDEAGILVWQDFPYACSYYPEDEKALKIARAEAEVNVKRLRGRACLALWCGNNENLTMWEGKWGGAQSPPKFYGEKIYNEVLPAVLAELDPARSYIPTSPIGQDDTTKPDCNMGRFGDSHYWDVWHGRGDWVNYRDSDARFSSEFGFASSCSLALWEEVISPADWQHDSPAVRWHDKTGKPYEKFFGYVCEHYPEPSSLEEWTYYSQLNQRDALRFGIEHWRRSPSCQGTLIWQFNDCWPVQSWAVQDYMKLLKPAGFELERLYFDRLISLVKRDGAIEIHLVNDGPEVWNDTLTLQIFSPLDGSVIHTERLECALAPRGREMVRLLETARFEPVLVRVFGEDGVVAECLTAEPKETEFGTPKFEFDLSEDELVVTVEGIAVDLVLIDLELPDNLISIGNELMGAQAITLVNESWSFRFGTPPRLVSATWLHGNAVIDLSDDEISFS